MDDEDPVGVRLVQHGREVERPAAVLELDAAELALGTRQVDHGPVPRGIGAVRTSLPTRRKPSRL